MNPERTLTDIAMQITQCRKAGTTNLHICRWEKKIQVLHREHTLLVHPVLHLVTPEETHAGLTSKMWNRLRDKIAKTQKGELV